jgi:hypothetical protein
MMRNNSWPGHNDEVSRYQSHLHCQAQSSRHWLTFWLPRASVAPPCAGPWCHSHKATRAAHESLVSSDQVSLRPDQISCAAVSAACMKGLSIAVVPSLGATTVTAVPRATIRPRLRVASDTIVGSSGSARGRTEQMTPMDSSLGGTAQRTA